MATYEVHVTGEDTPLLLKLDEEDEEDNSHFGICKKITSIVLLLALVVFCFWLLFAPPPVWLKNFVHWIEASSDGHPRFFLYFALIYVASILICFPFTGFLEMAAGPMLGFWFGLLFIALLKALAACIAFGLGRTLLRSRILHVLLKYPRFMFFMFALGDDGWKSVVLMRLSGFPNCFVNYICALLPNLEFLPYAVATLFSQPVLAFQNVYVGAVIADAVDHPQSEQTAVKISFVVLTFVATALLMWRVSIHLNERLENIHRSPA